MKQWSRIPTIYLFVIGLALISIVFISVYFINNPLEKGVSRISYPYALSVNKGIISQDGTVNIFVTRMDETLNETLKLYVIDPNGRSVKYNLANEDYEEFIFPSIDNYRRPLPIGNYSVLLTTTFTKNVLHVGFDVVLNPHLNSFGKFSFGEGLPLTIALVISIFSTAFQFASSREAEKRREKSDIEAEKRQQQAEAAADRRRLLSDKSKWMVDNSKYYLGLSADAIEVCNSFPINDQNLPEFDIAKHKDSDIVSFNLLFNMIKFYETYRRFRTEFNLYYFNNLASEAFIGKIDQLIFCLYDEIFMDKILLTQFFGKESYELKDDPIIKKLKEKLKTWSSGITENIKNSERLYKFYYMYYTLLTITINEVVNELYFDREEHKKSIYQLVKEHLLLLEGGLELINKRLYEADKAKYFRIMFNGEDILEKVKGNMK